MIRRGDVETLTVEPGTELAGYRILYKIGEGGMGVVWKALDTRLDREVALKVLPEELAADPDRLKRFKREARALAALNHPGVVTIHSVEEVDDLHFITMELVEGRPLDELIPEDGFTLGEFFDIAISLTDALSAAHERGIVHRDLKPANVMVGPDRHVKILDFGLAKLEANPFKSTSDATTLASTMVTADGHVVGTVPYMSPEQLQAKELDHRSDVFSTGVVLYEMATGQRPFTGGSSVDLMSSILRDAPKPLTDVKVNFPNHLGRIVRHCLEKEADRRYQTAKDIRNELEDLRGEISVGQLPKKIGTRRRPWPKSGRRALALLGAGVGIVVIVATLFLLPRGAKADLGGSAIAVLPFANLTGDAANDYLGDGLSAGLSTRLGEVSAIRVIGRSTWLEKIRGRDPQEVARELGVGLFLEGSVQAQQAVLRVDLTLVQPGSGLVLWAGQFDGKKEEMFALQRGIAGELVKILSIRLSPRELKRLGRDPTRSVKAYEYFLRAHKHMESVYKDPTAANAAVELFRHAIRLDSEFALAHADLSKALWYGSRVDGGGEKLEQAEQAAQRSLDIDADLPAGLVAIARVYRDTGRYAESIERLEQALASHPKPDDALRELAATYEEVGDLEEAERCVRSAATLGRDDWFNWNELGSLLQRAGRYAEAREAFETAAESASSTATTPAENLAAMTILEGRFNDALEIYSQIPRPIEDPWLASNIGTAYYFSDHPDKWKHAETHYRLAARLNPHSAVIQSNLADLYLEIDEKDAALFHYREALHIIETQLEADPQSYALRLDRAIYAAKSRMCTTATPLADTLNRELPRTADNAHRLAKVYGTCDRPEAALEQIDEAIRLGFSAEIIRQEPEFVTLRGTPEFESLTSTGP